MKHYCPECDQKAEEVLSLTGMDKAAWEALGIEKNCFYAWIRKHPTFSAAVNRGREFWRSNCPEVQRIMLLSYMASVLLAGNESVVKRTVQSFVEREVKRDRNNNQPIGYTDRHRTIEKVVTRQTGIPKWIANKVMENASGLNEAIIKVMAAGYEMRRPGDAVGDRH